MRIALVHFLAGVREGGSERIVKHLAARLAARGHDVHVYTNDGPVMFDQRVRVCRIPYIPLFGKLDYWSKILTFSLFASMGILFRRYDAVHAFFYLDSYLPIVAGKMTGAATVFTFCGVLDKEAPAGRLAGRSAALTETGRRLYANLGVRNITVIPNGADRALPLTNRSAVRKRLGIRPDEIAVLTVARPDEIKDPWLLRDIILRSGKKFKFVLVGISEAEPLKSLSHERAIKLGILPSGEVAQYYAASDLFLLTSRSEGFPGVILEALSAGLPVLATNVGGIPDVLNSSVGSFIDRDPAKAARTLNAFTKRKIASMRTRCRAYARRSYDWDIVAAQYERLYRVA